MKRGLILIFLILISSVVLSDSFNWVAQGGDDFSWVRQADYTFSSVAREAHDYSFLIVETLFGNFSVFFLIAVFGYSLYFLFLFYSRFYFKKQIPYDPTVLALLAVNLFVLDTFIVNGWRIFDLIFVYWFQSVIIGFFQILKILSSKKFSVEGETLLGFPSEEKPGSKTIVALFFGLHYGIYHLMIAFLTGIFEFKVIGSLAFIIIILFFINHLFSFLYYKKDIENRKPVISLKMYWPYARVIPMHVFVISGVVLASNPIAPLFFVIMKTGADIYMHLTEHDKGFSAKNTSFFKKKN